MNPQIDVGDHVCSGVWMIFLLDSRYRLHNSIHLKKFEWLVLNENPHKTRSWTFDKCISISEVVLKRHLYSGASSSSGLRKYIGWEHRKANLTFFNVQPLFLMIFKSKQRGKRESEMLADVRCVKYRRIPLCRGNLWS